LAKKIFPFGPKPAKIKAMKFIDFCFDIFFHVGLSFPDMDAPLAQRVKSPFKGKICLFFSTLGRVGWLFSY
jgi:hypothetical protein